MLQICSSNMKMGSRKGHIWEKEWQVHGLHDDRHHDSYRERTKSI